MAIFTATGLMVFTVFSLSAGAVGSMVSGSINAQNANKNKCANEANMESVLQKYEEYNQKIQNFIDSDNQEISQLQTEIAQQKAQMDVYKKAIQDHNQNYKKYINTIYTVFGVFAGLTVFLCILKVIATKKYRHKMKKKYLDSLK